MRNCQTESTIDDGVDKAAYKTKTNTVDIRKLLNLNKIGRSMTAQGSQKEMQRIKKPK